MSTFKLKIYKAYIVREPFWKWQISSWLLLLLVLKSFPVSDSVVVLYYEHFWQDLTSIPQLNSQPYTVDLSISFGCTKRMVVRMVLVYLVLSRKGPQTFLGLGEAFSCWTSQCWSIAKTNPDPTNGTPQADPFILIDLIADLGPKCVPSAVIFLTIMKIRLQY